MTMDVRNERSQRMIIAAITALAGVFVVAAESPAQTLQETVEKAVRTNPTIGVVTSNRQAVDQELRQARGLYLPQIDIRGAVGPEWTDSPGTRARGLGTTQETRIERQIVLQQRLFDGFEAVSEVERQQARSKSAAERVRESSEFTGLDAVEAHINVLRQRRLVQIAEENVEAHRRLVNRVRQRVTGGAGTTADIAQAQARLDQASATLSDTRNGLRDAEALFIRVVGERPGQLAEAPYPRDALPANLDAAVSTLTATSPTVAIREADVVAGDAEVDVAESRFYPRLSLELSGRADRNIDGVEGSDNDAMALVVLRWNLYRGGIDVANRREALGRLAQAKNARLVAVRGSEEELRRSWAALESASERTESLRSAVERNVQVRDAYNQQFEIGQRSLLDLLDSENELFVSKGRLFTAEAQRVFAGYRVLAVQGKLGPALGVALPVEADASRPAPEPPDRDWRITR